MESDSRYQITVPLDLYHCFAYCKQAKETELVTIRSNLWKEDNHCLEWLDKQSPKSVIYLNYGSLATLTVDQLKEVAMGLANCKYPFLWVIRPDVLNGGSDVITKGYLEEVNERGLISGWAPHEMVLRHTSIAVFLTLCGWNSTLESISERVPMICWPFFAEQQMNCLYACHKWKVGLEMKGEVSVEKVEGLVTQVMEGEIGTGMKKQANDWKMKADNATRPGGTSQSNFDILVRSLVGKDQGYGTT